MLRLDLGVNAGSRASRHLRQAKLIGGAPEVIRTPDLRLRRPSLYPAELRARSRLSLGEYCRILRVGVSEGIRTLDHRSHSPALYQLSYAHHPGEHCLACLEGLEPPTRGLEGRRSIQLSYRQLVSGYRQLLSKSSAGGKRLLGVSGRPDLNWGPPAPKAGALPGCATPRQKPGAAV